MKDLSQIVCHQQMCAQHGIPCYTVKIAIIWGNKIIVLKRDKRNIELVGGMNVPEDDCDVYKTVQRKVLSETGIVIDREQMEFVFMTSWSDNHTFYFFRVVVDDDATRTIRQSPCENGGIPKAYELGSVLDIPPSLPKLHQKILREHIITA